MNSNRNIIDISKKMNMEPAKSNSNVVGNAKVYKYIETIDKL